MIYVKATKNTDNLAWTFSPLDKSMLALVNSGSWLFAHSLDVEKLQSSLAEVLCNYPLFCGRMLCPDQLTYTNDGVQFDIAKISKFTVNQLLSLWYLPRSLKANFNLSAFRKGKSTPLSIKVTPLQNAVLLSIAVSHVCADGVTLYRFMNDWAKVYRGETPEKPIINQQVVPQLLHSKETLMNLLPRLGWHKVGLSCLLKYAFSFILGTNGRPKTTLFLTQTQIEQLRRKCLAEQGEKYSTHVLLCAFMAKLTAMLEKHPETHFSSVSIVDLRGRMEIPANFIGNAATNIPCAVFDSSAGFSRMAQKINDGLQQKLQSPQRIKNLFRLNLEAIGRKMPYVCFDLAGHNRKKISCFVVNDFRKFSVYDVNFGDGIPLKAYPNDLTDNLKIWPATPAEKGLYILLQGNMANIVNRAENKEKVIQQICEA